MDFETVDWIGKISNPLCQHLANQIMCPKATQLSSCTRPPLLWGSGSYGDQNASASHLLYYPRDRNTLLSPPSQQNNLPDDFEPTICLFSFKGSSSSSATKKRKCNNWYIYLSLRARQEMTTVRNNPPLKHTLIAVDAFPTLATLLYPPQYCFGQLANSGLKYQPMWKNREDCLKILGKRKTASSKVGQLVLPQCFSHDISCGFIES